MRDKGNVEYAVMCCTIAGSKSCAVNHDFNRKILKTNVMKKIVVASLKKRRVNSNKGNITVCGKACRECHCVLLRNTNVKVSIGVFCTKGLKSCANSHSGSYGKNSFVLVSEVNELI